MKMSTETLNKLLSMARETLDASLKNNRSQAIVILTQIGNIYCFYAPWEEYCATEDQIVTILAEKNDTAVAAVLGMWEDGCVDVVSYKLREKLVTLDERNREALLVLQGQAGYVVRTIDASIVKK